MSASSSDEDSCPKLSILPERSRERYLKAYELFNDWRLSKGYKTYSETVLLSYFMELSETRQPSTLWSIYSMLKTVIKTEQDGNIETYPKLMAFLKSKAEGFKSKKSKVFTANEIEEFLNDAPDHKFLAIKVCLIIGINGACRSNELLNLTVKDIEKYSDKLILVNLHSTSTKKKIDRSFVIREEYVDIVSKYMALRPDHTKTNRFFLQYEKGKCRAQPMGINKFGVIPQKIASFLKLKDPHLYTSHCLRRTSAKLLADSRADLTVIKRQRESGCGNGGGGNGSSSGGDSKSISFAEVIIEDSFDNKSEVQKSIIESIKSRLVQSTPSTSKDNTESCQGSPSPSESPPQSTKTETSEILINDTTIKIPNKNITINLKNCSNLTFKF